MAIFRPPDMHRIKRVLIVKLSALGDVVHALPVSAALGDAFPHLQISWLVEERAAPLLDGNPYLHEVIVLPRDWYRRPWLPATWRRWGTIRRNLRSKQFDLALDLQGLSRSALLAWLSGARYRFGYDWLREIAPFLVQRVPRRPESVHIADQLLDVVRFLGADVKKAKFPLVIADREAAAAERLLRDVGIEPHQPFIAINPTDGGYAHKGWGAGRLTALLNDLAGDMVMPVVLVGGPDDRPIGEAIQKGCRVPPASLIGRTSLKELAAVLQRAALHLSGDTGSAHIAAALGTPVISIFGRSNPARLAPYGQKHLALHHREQCAAACRHYHQSAPLNTNQKCLAPPPQCLAAVSVMEVAATVRRCLAHTVAA